MRILVRWLPCLAFVAVGMLGGAAVVQNTQVVAQGTGGGSSTGEARGGASEWLRRASELLGGGGGGGGAARPFDASTAAILGAGDSGSLELAIVAKKERILALGRANARLEGEQSEILERARRREAEQTATAQRHLRSGSAAAADAADARAERAAAASSSEAHAFKATAGGKPRRHAAAAAGKSKMISFYNRAARCSLAVAAQRGEQEGDWLRCERDATGTDAVFELTPGSSAPGAVRLRSVANGKFVQLLPPGDELQWVLSANLERLEAGHKARYEFELLDGAYVRNVGAQACVTAVVQDRSGGNAGATVPVRGHGNKPNNHLAGGRDAYSAWEWRWMDDAMVAQAKEEVKAAETRLKAEADELSVQLRSPSANFTEKRVVSYGLYGADAKYTTGAIRNSELVHEVFPGWVARFYCRSDVPVGVIAELERNGAEIVPMGGGGKQQGIAGMFWRFLVADDPTVDRYIIRDSDSRLNARERFAVEEWILSGLKVHTIRDHPNHDRPLNGGLWGGVKGAVPGMARKVSEFANKGSYGGDLQFLNTVVWPLVKNSQLGHDAYTCQKWPNTRPFPTQRPANYQHVGQVFFADETFRVGDINGFMRGREIPRVCRKHPDWKFG